MPPTRMSEKITVSVKHAGKTHQVEVDVNQPATVFKESIYQVTGVPVDRMKVMIKGLLKDDADLSRLALKPNQAVTVIGTAGPLPTAPQEQIVFLEDMADSQLALLSGTPPGLVNLGQTCYLNSSLQVLRALPQLQVALDGPISVPNTPEGTLTQSMRNLYSGMAQTTEAVPPFVLLSALRSLAPQFAEMDRSGRFAQQDADEAWTQLISALRVSLPGFIDNHMTVELTTTSSSPEAPDEPPTVNIDRVLKLECNISINTNFLLSGILDSLDQQIEKTSPTLGRTATYSQKSRLSRLPQILAVHMVRFYWRRDIQKKAKIMRKVKFPLQFDVLDLVTDDLRTRISPVNSATRQILKDRDDRAKIAKRDKGRAKAEGKSEDELRTEEDQTVQELIDTNQLKEPGSNPTGIYELCGVVTHKGASADSGHYIGWVRKEDTRAPSGEEEWYKFDDDKVSTVTADKILNMDGGGEDSVAYILLYRPAVSV
ncbi:ubiquitin C-terminal hydrolase [Naematelia encephala]|uniref:Ubiquitin carboxyl-terminal hydrolase n=1 Tax=Naematelia encephala TaxID=71784 RepID=A0A1Y2AJF4_9TREE|nr:ubiquitin C-terminal hydrolase [Naematelia encephala]